VRRKSPTLDAQEQEVTVADTGSKPWYYRAKVVTGLVVGVLAVVFVLQNTDQKHVTFLLWSWSMPLWIWLLVIFAAGVVVGSVFPWLRRRRG
jgi:uncharacterized integral membrane protein